MNEMNIFKDEMFKDIGQKEQLQYLGSLSLTFRSTPSSIANNAFGACSGLTTIHVPWASGAVADAPWGATNAVIHYNDSGEGA